VEVSRLFNGNPAMIALFAESLDRIDQGLEITVTHRVVLNEWAAKARPELQRMQFKAQKGMQSDEFYADMVSIKETLGKISPYLATKE
jgi:hypothetical protein